MPDPPGPPVRRVSGDRSLKSGRRERTWVGKDSTLPGCVRRAIPGNSEPSFSGGIIRPIERDFKITALDAIVG